MVRQVTYTTPGRFREEDFVERSALAVLRYGMTNPENVECDVVVYKEAVRLVVPRAALLVALDRPNLTRDFAFGHADLNGKPAVTISFRGGSARKVTLGREPLGVFLARTQMLVPVDAVDRVLRTL